MIQISLNRRVVGVVPTLSGRYRIGSRYSVEVDLRFIIPREGFRELRLTSELFGGKIYLKVADNLKGFGFCNKGMVEVVFDCELVEEPGWVWKNSPRVVFADVGRKIRVRV